MNLSFQPMIVYPTSKYTPSQVKSNISKIFVDILGREPSATEMTKWYDAITKNIYAYRDLQNMIYASDEFISRQSGTGKTLPSAEPIIEVKEKPKAGVLVAVSAGVLYLLSLI